MRQTKIFLLLVLSAILLTPAEPVIAEPMPVSLTVSSTAPYGDILGYGWEETKSGGLLPTYLLQETIPHLITIVLDNGAVEQFDFTPTPRSQLVVPLQFLTAEFTPRPGTVGALFVSSANLLVSGGPIGNVELIDLDTFEVFNPRHYFYLGAGQQFPVELPKNFQAQVPEPATFFLLASGLAGLAGMTWTARRRA